MSDCEFCEDGHEDPLRRPWAVYVHPSERDGDGQPISLMVSKTGCQHVAESDAEWLRQLIRDARYRPTAELLHERNEAEAVVEQVRGIVKQWADRDEPLPDDAATILAQLIIVLHEAGYR